MTSRIKLNFLINLILFFVFVNSKYQNNYNYCDICEDHIGCNNDGELNENCPDKSKVLVMDNRLRETILKIHNHNRDKIAQGKVKNFKPAKRMGTMQWDEELQYLAELNVKKCDFNHDDCHDTERFHYCGQNLATWKGFPMRHMYLSVRHCLSHWFTEHSDANMTLIDSFYVTPKTTAHFAVMITDRNTKVGCGGLEIEEPPYLTLTIVCNYATTNIIDQPVYVQGITGSGCKKGTNPIYPGLCSINEDIDPNHFPLDQ